jgi:hypothetical protein
MAGPLNIPEEKRTPDTSLRDRAQASIAVAFLAGMWAGLGSHYLHRSTYSSVWIAYFISSLVFLGIAVRRVGSMFGRSVTSQESKGA